jgi:hypothetical protein
LNFSPLDGTMGFGMTPLEHSVSGVWPMLFPPAEIAAILDTVRQDRQKQYFDGILANINLCLAEGHGVVVRLGASGDKGMPGYLIMYTQDGSPRHRGYSYINNTEPTVNPHGGTWTTESMSLDQFKAYLANKDAPAKTA